MDREALMEQLVELTNKEELKDKFEAVSNMEEMRALLRENGMNADDETLDALVATAVYCTNNDNDGELDEEELEAVSGGINLLKVARKTWKWGIRFSSVMLGKTPKETTNMVVGYWKKKIFGQK